MKQTPTLLLTLLMPFMSADLGAEEVAKPSKPNIIVIRKTTTEPNP